MIIRVYAGKNPAPSLSKRVKAWIKKGLLDLGKHRGEKSRAHLKSECGLRPNYHQLEHRVDAHIFISILAYQIQRFILYKLELSGDHRVWSTLRRVLQTHCYSTMIIPTTQGATYRIRKPGKPEECQRQIYNQLGIQLEQLPKTKIVTQKKLSTL